MSSKSFLSSIPAPLFRRSVKEYIHDQEPIKCLGSDSPSLRLLSSRQEEFTLVLKGIDREIIHHIFQFLRSKYGLEITPAVNIEASPGLQSLRGETDSIEAFILSNDRGMEMPLPDTFLHPTEQFLKTINREIEKSLEDENFRIPMLARRLYMGEMQLGRKLKRLTTLTPSHYVRKYRLYRSKSFLKDPLNSILQVSQMVGFQSHEYYSRSFRKEFDISPSDFRKSWNSSKRR